MVSDERLPLDVAQLETFAVRAAVEVVTRRAVEAEEAPDRARGAVAVELAPLDDTTPLGYLAARARLDAVEIALLRVLLAAELDGAVHRALRRLAQDPTRVGVEVDALLRVVGALGIAEREALLAFAPTGRLLRSGLVAWARAEGPLITRRVMVPPSVVAYSQGRFPAPTDDPPLSIESPVETASLTVRPDDADMSAVRSRSRSAGCRSGSSGAQASASARCSQRYVAR